MWSRAEIVSNQILAYLLLQGKKLNMDAANYNLHLDQQTHKSIPKVIIS